MHGGNLSAAGHLGHTPGSTIWPESPPYYHGHDHGGYNATAVRIAVQEAQARSEAEARAGKEQPEHLSEEEQGAAVEVAEEVETAPHSK
jgi:hypothetical protein